MKHSFCPSLGMMYQPGRQACVVFKEGLQLTGDVTCRRDVSAKPGKKGDDEDVGTTVDFEQLAPQVGRMPP